MAARQGRGSHREQRRLANSARAGPLKVGDARGLTRSFPRKRESSLGPHFRGDERSWQCIQASPT